MKKYTYLLIAFFSLNLVQIKVHALSPTCYQAYTVGEDKVFYCENGEESEVLDVDLDSFETLDELGWGFAKDMNKFYCGGKEIDADHNSFAEIEGSYGYYKDDSSVFHDCSKLENSDPTTFENIDGDKWFYRDKNNIYYRGEILSGADQNTFQILDSGYSKDSSYVYFTHKVVAGADPESFEIEKLTRDFEWFCDNFSDARDKNRYYANGAVVYNDDSAECLRGPEGNLTFPDVTEDAYYKASIEWMADRGVIEGYPNGLFEPDACVNRVEFLKMLFETREIIDPSEYTAELFKDTKEGEWYIPYVMAGRARGIISGYPDGYFRPEQCVNRVEAIKMAVLEFNGGGNFDVTESLMDATYNFMAASLVLPYDIDLLINDLMEDTNLIKDKPWWLDYFLMVWVSNTLATEHFPHFNATPSNLAITESTYNFSPDQPMSRKEVSEMLYRMKVVQDYNLKVYSPAVR